MELLKSEKNGIYINLLYKTTHFLNWNEILAMMQVFCEDLKHISFIEYTDCKDTKPKEIKFIKNNLIHKEKELQQNGYSISITGVSNFMDIPIKITAYNQLDIINVQVTLIHTDIIEEFKKSEHVFDDYMNNLEINTYCNLSTKKHLERVFSLIKQFELKREIDIDVLPNYDRFGFDFYTMFEENSCPSCNTIWFSNVDNIPLDSKYEVTCPKCNMLVKKKRR